MARDYPLVPDLYYSWVGTDRVNALLAALPSPLHLRGTGFTMREDGDVWLAAGVLTGPTQTAAPVRPLHVGVLHGVSAAPRVFVATPAPPINAGFARRAEREYWEWREALMASLPPRSRPRLGAELNVLVPGERPKDDPPAILFARNMANEAWYASGLDVSRLFIESGNTDPNQRWGPSLLGGLFKTVALGLPFAVAGLAGAPLLATRVASSAVSAATKR